VKPRKYGGTNPPFFSHSSLFSLMLSLDPNFTGLLGPLFVLLTNLYMQWIRGRHW
jgi:hypothetical protein